MAPPAKSSSSSKKAFQLLEINLMSAQDLAPVSKKMKTYAKAWVHPGRKLLSCVDSEGGNNPSWNDKFVFRVDEGFLTEDTSAVMIEIYASHWLRDVLVGTVRVLVGNLIPPPVLSMLNNNHHHQIGMRFVALQVRRPSGRPQGIMNIGVALLDGSLRSMPMYAQDGASAVGYRDLMRDPPKKILRRSRSERSDGFSSSPNSSIVAVPKKKRADDDKESSILSISEFVEYPLKGMMPKAEKKPALNGMSALVIPENKFVVVDEKSVTTAKGVVQNAGQAPRVKDLIAKFDVYDSKNEEEVGPLKGNSMWSDSDVGPSASEVAAVMAERRYPLNDNQSSVLDGWSVDESVEGLRSKLERWRMDLPPVYDNGYSSSSSCKSSSVSRKKRSGGGSGLFSCFGNVCGFECKVVFGKPPPRRIRGSR